MLELTHDHHNKTHGGVKDLLDLATSIKDDVNTIDNSQEEIKGKVKMPTFFLPSIVISHIIIYQI